MSPRRLLQSQFKRSRSKPSSKKSSNNHSSPKNPKNPTLTPKKIQQTPQKQCTKHKRTNKQSENRFMYSASIMKNNLSFYSTKARINYDEGLDEIQKYLRERGGVIKKSKKDTKQNSGKKAFIVQKQTEQKKKNKSQIQEMPQIHEETQESREILSSSFHEQSIVDFDKFLQQKQTSKTSSEIKHEIQTQFEKDQEVLNEQTQKFARRRRKNNQRVIPDDDDANYQPPQSPTPPIPKQKKTFPCVTNPSIQQLITLIFDKKRTKKLTEISSQRFLNVINDVNDSIQQYGLIDSVQIPYYRRVIDSVREINEDVWAGKEIKSAIKKKRMVPWLFPQKRIPTEEERSRMVTRIRIKKRQPPKDESAMKPARIPQIPKFYGRSSTKKPATTLPSQDSFDWIQKESQHLSYHTQTVYQKIRTSADTFQYYQSGCHSLLAQPFLSVPKLSTFTSLQQWNTDNCEAFYDLDDNYYKALDERNHEFCGTIQVDKAYGKDLVAGCGVYMRGVFEVFGLLDSDEEGEEERDSEEEGDEGNQEEEDLNNEEGRHNGNKKKQQEEFLTQEEDSLLLKYLKQDIEQFKQSNLLTLHICNDEDDAPKSQWDYYMQDLQIYNQKKLDNKANENLNQSRQISNTVTVFRKKANENIK